MSDLVHRGDHKLAAYSLTLKFALSTSNSIGLFPFSSIRRRARSLFGPDDDVSDLDDDGSAWSRPLRRLRTRQYGACRPR